MPDVGLDWALQEVSKNGHLAMTQYLIEKLGASPKANDCGWFPIHLAAEKGHAGVVQYLLEQKVDVNLATTNDWGDTPLHIAASNGYLEVIKKLLKSGAKHSPNKKGLYEDLSG